MVRKACHVYHPPEMEEACLTEEQGRLTHLGFFWPGLLLTQTDFPVWRQAGCKVWVLLRLQGQTGSGQTGTVWWLGVVAGTLWVSEAASVSLDHQPSPEKHRYRLTWAAKLLSLRRHCGCDHCAAERKVATKQDLSRLVSFNEQRACSIRSTDSGSGSRPLEGMNTSTLSGRSPADVRNNPLLRQMTVGLRDGGW
jgi:hypothetical protein